MSTLFKKRKTCCEQTGAPALVRAEPEKRLLQGEYTGSFLRCQLYAPKKMFFFLQARATGWSQVANDKKELHKVIGCITWEAARKFYGAVQNCTSATCRIEKKPKNAKAKPKKQHPHNQQRQQAENYVHGSKVFFPLQARATGDRSRRWRRQMWKLYTVNGCTRREVRKFSRIQKISFSGAKVDELRDVATW